MSISIKEIWETGIPINECHFLQQSKVKCKVHHIGDHEGPDVERYSSTLSLTSALDGVGGKRHAPDTLTPGQTRYPVYRRMGGPQGRSRRVWKISPPPGFDIRTVQPVASRYTDWPISATTFKSLLFIYKQNVFVTFALSRLWEYLKQGTNRILMPSCPAHLRWKYRPLNATVAQSKNCNLEFMLWLR